MAEERMFVMKKFVNLMDSACKSSTLKGIIKIYFVTPLYFISYVLLLLIFYLLKKTVLVVNML
jgi:hypothetical protein